MKKKYKIVLNRDITDTVYGRVQLFTKGTSYELEKSGLEFVKEDGYLAICHGHGVYTYLIYPDWFDLYEIEETTQRKERKVS